MVGQFDLPPTVTKTWFHNGAYLKEGRLEAYFKNREFFSDDPQASFLPDTALPPNLTDDEMREAARALKGSILRQEVYADDGSPKALLPYSVSERNYRLTCMQPRAVFLIHSRETLEYLYERNPADPRISHALTLAVDDYGNVLKSAAIGYQRCAPAFDEQKQTLATLTESQYTNAILQDDAYRAPLPAEAKTYELSAPALAGVTPLDFATVDSVAATATEIAYETQPTSGQTQKRLIAQAAHDTTARMISRPYRRRHGRVHGAAGRELQAGADSGPARSFSKQGDGGRPDEHPHRRGWRVPQPRRRRQSLDSRPARCSTRRVRAMRRPRSSPLRTAHFFLPLSLPRSVRQRHGRDLRYEIHSASRARRRTRSATRRRPTMTIACCSP